MFTKLACRACEGFENLKFIFQSDDENIPYKLMNCASVQVSKDDELPQFICSRCIRDLNCAFSFKKRCEDLDYKFRQLVPNLQIKLECEPITSILKDDPDIKRDLQSINCLNNNENIVKAIQNDEEYDFPYCMAADIVPVTYNQKKQEAKSNGKRRKSASPPELLVCTGCDYTSLDKSELLEHKKIHGNKRFLCKLCNKRWFNNSKELTNHQNSHKKVEECTSFECPICGKKIINKQNLGRHIKIHTNDKKHECDICHKAFIQSTTLIKHKLTHSDNKDFPCTDCSKAFKTQKYLDSHRRHIHKDYSKFSYPCTKCNRLFKTERTLEWHLKQHDLNLIILNKPQIPKKKKTSSTLKKKCAARTTISAVCNFCGKTFTNRHHLMLHERVHTGEKPYECKICCKRFTFSVSYRSHMNIHTGARPYVCKICNVGFRQSSHLTLHKMKHSGVMPHKCSFCDKAFRLKGNYDVHVRTHTGERPYVCQTCGEGFIDLNRLKKHVKKHESSI